MARRVKKAISQEVLAKTKKLLWDWVPSGPSFRRLLWTGGPISSAMLWYCFCGNKRRLHVRGFGISLAGASAMSCEVSALFFAEVSAIKCGVSVSFFVAMCAIWCGVSASFSPRRAPSGAGIRNLVCGGGCRQV